MFSKRLSKMLMRFVRTLKALSTVMKMKKAKKAVLKTGTDGCGGLTRR